MTSSRVKQFLSSPLPWMFVDQSVVVILRQLLYLLIQVVKAFSSINLSAEVSYLHVSLVMPAVLLGTNILDSWVCMRSVKNFLPIFFSFFPNLLIVLLGLVKEPFLVPFSWAVLSRWRILIHSVVIAFVWSLCPRLDPFDQSCIFISFCHLEFRNYFFNSLKFLGAWIFSLLSLFCKLTHTFLSSSHSFNNLPTSWSVKSSGPQEPSLWIKLVEMLGFQLSYLKS